MMISAPSRNAGFSMIEVLVSLIIIVIGVLGMVALQSKAIPYTQDSVQRNAAIMLVDDLLEIIRSAPADCTDANSCLKAPGSPFPAPATKCIPTPATLSEQIGCWAIRAGATLPGADTLLASSFYICKTPTKDNADNVDACTTSSATNTELQIQVAWTVKNEAECMSGSTLAATGTCTYRLRTRIR
ncbi:type IV pilus modification protein PilV [Pseudomonas sp. efr-133-TYG-103a]|uniref:type IV pilus modification protein PilV n=1 Tax=Pseudomonas sp. efr-133-TYG-103a TaxID=3040308 RepID=UPI00359C5213